MNLSPDDSSQILLVEDDPDIRAMISANLNAAGFRVKQAADGLQAYESACAWPPDLVLLDLMLPKLSGNEVCKLLKANPATARVPIVMLTARADEIDRVLGFELGVDDYITKPFSPRELVLRIRAVLRRVSQERQGTGKLESGGITLDPHRREVRVRGEQISVTAMEFKLLKVLMEHAGAVQSREVLLKDVWNYQTDMDTRTVDTHIRRLREKLGPVADCIKTFRGSGYSFHECNPSI